MIVILYSNFCILYNREYLAPQIHSMNNLFHSEAKLPWSYAYRLANHIATTKSSANREMPLVSRLYPSFGYLRKIFPPRGLKSSLFTIQELVYNTCKWFNLPLTFCNMLGNSQRNLLAGVIYTGRLCIHAPILGRSGPSSFSCRRPTSRLSRIVVYMGL